MEVVTIVDFPSWLLQMISSFSSFLFPLSSPKIKTHLCRQKKKTAADPSASYKGNRGRESPPTVELLLKGAVREYIYWRGGSRHRHRSFNPRANKNSEHTPHHFIVPKHGNFNSKSSSRRFSGYFSPKNVLRCKRRNLPFGRWCLS